MSPAIRKTILFISLFLLSSCIWAQDIIALKKEAYDLYTKRQYAAALKAYESLISKTSQQKYTSEIAEIRFYYARVLQITGKSKEALKVFHEAESMYENLQMHDKKWLTAQQIASLQDDLGQYAESIETGKLALAYYTKTKDSLQIAFVLHNLAFGYYHSGKVKEALDCHTKEILFLGNKDLPLLARAFNQLGNIWAVDLRDNYKALEYYQKSLAIKLPLNDPGSISASYNNIGITYKDLNEPDKALSNYELALAYGKKTGIASQEYNPLINIANLHKRYNRYPEALATYAKALALKDRVTKRQQNILYNNLGMVNQELGNYDSALFYYNKSMALTEGSGDNTSLAQTELAISKAYVSKKDYEKAYIHFVKHKAYTDSLYEGDRKKALAEMMIKYESAKKDLDLIEAKREIEKKEQQQLLLIKEKELQKKISEAALQESKLKEELAINQKNAIALNAQQAELMSAKQLNEKQQQLLQNENHLRKRTLGLTIAVSIALLLGLLAFYQRRQKTAALKQSALELQLAKTASVNKIQEERLRISRELHDNIGSHLTLINATVESMPCINVEDITPQVAVVKNSLVMSMRELRRTVWLMNRSSVSLDELAVRLRDYLRPVLNQQLRVQVNVSGNTDLMLNDLVTTHLFRIIQESVNNAVKYARASLILVSLTATGNAISFSVEDDGIGFDVAENKEGNGLKNMQYRIQELNGTMQVESTSGKTIISGSFVNPN